MCASAIMTALGQINVKTTFLSNEFRGSAPYIDAHRGCTFVIYVEGEAFESPCEALIQDLALLHTLGVKLVLVFGCQPQAEAALATSGHPLRKHCGRWIVDQQGMNAIAAQTQLLRMMIEARFSVGLPNTPLHGLDIVTASGNLVMARPFGVRDGVDGLYAGDVRHVRSDAIRELLARDMLVIIPPIGYSSTGELFDLDATEVASHVAIAMQADKLILLGQHDGVCNEDGLLEHQMEPEQARALSNATMPEALRHQLEAACLAACKGVKRAHLLSWNDRDALLGELFTRDGMGTMITQERYEQLRTATNTDIAGLMELLRPLEERQILVPRSRERLEQQISDYTVIDRDGMTIGCAALHGYPQDECGELACVAVHEGYRDGERGTRLLEAIERKARRQGLRQLFALTTHTSHWFLEHGFVPAGIDQLPEARRSAYNTQRNSKVLVKPLV